MQHCKNEMPEVKKKNSHNALKQARQVEEYIFLLLQGQ